MSSLLGLTNPAYPGEITQAGMLVTMSTAAGTYYPTASKPSTGALATGFRQVGVLSALPKITTGRDTEEVKTGIYGITQELLFKGMSGSVECEFYGVDPYFLSVGLGVLPVVATAASPTTLSSAITTDGATGNSALTVASSASFSVGDMVQVDLSANIATSCNMGRVLSTGTGAIVLDRVLRDVTPSSGASVAKVVSVMLPIGGSTPQKFSFAGMVDFPDGRIALVSFPKVYSSKPLSFGMGSGSDAVKIPVTFDAMGALDSTYGVLLGKIQIWA